MIAAFEQPIPQPPRGTSSWLAAVLTAGSVVWLAILILAPVLLRPGDSPLSRGAALVYAAASAICHQRPERSFNLDGVQLPVCARCLGLYASGAAAALLASGRWRRRVTAPRAARTTLALAAFPTALTVALEVAGLAAPSNLLRATSALPLGAAAGWIFVRLLRAEAVDAAESKAGG